MSLNTVTNTFPEAECVRHWSCEAGAIQKTLPFALFCRFHVGLEYLFAFQLGDGTAIASAKLST